MIHQNLKNITVTMPTGQDKIQWIAQGIGNGVDLGGKAAF